MAKMKVCLTFDEKMVETVKALAEIDSRSRSSMCNILIQEAIDARIKKNKNGK